MTFQIDALRLVVTVAAFAGAAGIMIGRALRRSRRNDADESERLRRLDVNRRGRIVAAEVVDLLESERTTTDAPRQRMVVYKYEVAGVTYEVSQDLSGLPSTPESGFSAGSQTASVKYDSKAPTNSIIVCEEWSGI
jgi:hypothetical protein